MKKVAYLLMPNFQVMLFGGISVFELANQSGPKPFYEISLISERGGAVKCSLGYAVSSESFEASKFDTVIVGGALRVEPATSGVVDFLNRRPELVAPCGLDVHWSLLPRSGRIVGWASRGNPLGICAATSVNLSKATCERGPHIHR